MAGDEEEFIIERGDPFSIYTKLFEIQCLELFLTKDGVNPHFKNKYSTLNNALRLLKPELIKHNLLLSFISRVENGKDTLTLKVVDVKNFSSVESTVTIDSSKGPQQSGSQITYFKRYLLESIFVLPVTDQTEDDGESADKEWLNLDSEQFVKVKAAIGRGEITSITQVRAKYAVSKKVETALGLN